MQTMTCNAGCSLERFHEGDCRSATGFDSDLLTPEELDAFHVRKTDIFSFLVESGPLSSTIQLLTTICNQRRALARKASQEPTC